MRTAIRSSPSASRVLLVCGSAGLYIQLGSPSLPDVPFASDSNGARVADTERVDIRTAAARLAEQLKTDPSNPQGWLLYARAKSLLSDWQKAGEAYRRAIDLGAAAPDEFSSYGETQVLAAGGVVPPSARDVFAKALAADPKNDVARYYTALADSQAGNVHRAIDGWLALAAELPEEAPCARRSRATLRMPPGQADCGATAAERSARRPRRADGGLLRNSPKAQRDEMIHGMVASSRRASKVEPDDVGGWLQLGRSYSVLRENDKAVDAYEHAARLRPDDVDIELLTLGAMTAGLQPSDPLPPRALTLLRQIAAVRPDQPQVLWYLGLEAVRAGHRDDAKRSWTKLLGQLPAGSADAALIKKALDALDGTRPP